MAESRGIQKGKRKSDKACLDIAEDRNEFTKIFEKHIQNRKKQKPDEEKPTTPSKSNGSNSCTDQSELISSPPSVKPIQKSGIIQTTLFNGKITPVISSADSSVASVISILKQSIDPDNFKHLDLKSTNRLIKDLTGGGGGICESLEDRFRQTVEHLEGLANMNSMMKKSESDFEVADSVNFLKIFGFSCPDETYDACKEAVKGAIMLQEGNQLLIEGRNVLKSAIAKLTNQKHD